MKKYFAHLRPLERRLAVGVVVVLILVLNFVFIWPHFSDWSQLKTRLKNARDTLASYQATVAQATNYQAQVKSLEGQGEFVALEDQAINFMRTIQAQAEASGVGRANYSRSIMPHERRIFYRTSAEHQCGRHRPAARGFPLQARLWRLDDPRA